MRLTMIAKVARPYRLSDGTIAPTLLPAYHYREVPGLIITEWPAQREDPVMRWGITHEASGARLGLWLYARKEDAEGALMRVAEFFDWRQAMPVLQAELELRSVFDPDVGNRLTNALHPKAARFE